MTSRRQRKPAMPGMVVPELIDRAVAMLPSGSRDIKELAKRIDYTYQNLWSVYRCVRPMPALRLKDLCRFIGLSDTQVIELMEEQDRNWRKLTEERAKEKAAQAAKAAETTNQKT